MIFDELDLRAVERIDRHLTVEDKTSAYSPHVPGDPQGGERIAQRIKAGRVVKSPLLSKAFDAAKKADSDISKIRNDNRVNPTDRHDYEMRIKSVMIEAVEAATVAEIKKIFDQFFGLRKAYELAKTDRNYSVSNDRLLRIREAELEHSFTDESKAMMLLDSMERNGYHEVEVLVLGSKSERAHLKMRELQKTIPPYLADRENIAKLHEVEALLELQPGQFQVFYIVDGETYPTVDVFHVMDCLQGQTAPTFEEIIN